MYLLQQPKNAINRWPMARNSFGATISNKYWYGDNLDNNGKNKIYSESGYISVRFTHLKNLFRIYSIKRLAETIDNLLFENRQIWICQYQSWLFIVQVFYQSRDRLFNMKNSVTELLISYFLFFLQFHNQSWNAISNKISVSEYEEINKKSIRKVLSPPLNLFIKKHSHNYKM